MKSYRQSTRIVDLRKRVEVHGLSHDPSGLERHNVDMGQDNSLNHLKAWRNFRRLTQQGLADAVDPPTTKQVIQALETGARGLSDKWLRRLAPALGTTAGFLLDHHPDDLDRDLVDMVAKAPPERKEIAREVLKSILKGTGTNG